MGDEYGSTPCCFLPDFITVILNAEPIGFKGKVAVYGDFPRVYRNLADLIATGDRIFHIESVQSYHSSLIGNYMAALTPGSGTLKSTTLEGAFIEALFLLSIFEGSTTNNPNGTRRLTMTLNPGTKKLTGSWTFDCVPALDTNGTPTYPIVTHLSGVGFNPGTAVKSANLPAAIVELASQINFREGDAAKNPGAAQKITALDNSGEDRTSTGAFDFDLNLTVNVDGSTKLVGATYLLD